MAAHSEATGLQAQFYRAKLRRDSSLAHSACIPSVVRVAATRVFSLNYSLGD